MKFSNGSDVDPTNLDRLAASIPSAYGIYKYDGTYYAEANLRGFDDYDDDNFADLCNNDVIPALFDSGDGPGGRIELTSPCYTLDSAIDMYPGIWIEGVFTSGKHVGGQTGAWPLGTTIECAANDITAFSFDFPLPTTTHYCTGLRRFYLVGCEYDSLAASTKPLIDMQCNNNYLSDIFFEEVIALYGNNGLRIYNNDTSDTYKIWNIYVTRCMWEDCNDAGILIESPRNLIIERVKITGCHFYGNCGTSGLGGIEIDGHNTYASYISHNSFEKENKSAIYALDEADGWIINSNVMYDCDVDGTDQGIIDLNDVDYFTINGNNIRNVTADNAKYGIHTDDNCTYCCMVGNVCRVKAGGDGIVKGAGAGMIGDATMNVEHPANL